MVDATGAGNEGTPTVRRTEPDRLHGQGRNAPAAGVSQTGHAVLLARCYPNLSRADTSFDEVILIDRHDRAIGTMPKLEAHRQGRCHRAISVIIRDTSGRLLLQQRARSKYHSAGMWTNTCCSHPRPAEAAADTAARRLVEEMGIAAPLEALFCMRYRAQVSKHLIEHEFVHVFGGVSDQTPSPDAGEVADWRWRSLRDITDDVDERPEAYTVWFRKLLCEFKTEIARFVSR